MRFAELDILKLGLIPLSILATTLISRRFGHGIGGLVSGLPLIAGPIIVLLLLAWPVTGSILPCFTLALHGHQATVNLLRCTGFDKTNVLPQEPSNAS